MFNVKIKYSSGDSDLTRGTQDEAREVATAAYLRMAAGDCGITDIISWEDF